MLCPKCGKPLVIVERNQIELDWCPKCEGFWFDVDEWKLLGVVSEKYNPFNYDAVLSKEKSRKCPVCGKIMHKIDMNGVLLDKCPNFHGVWFDKGELSQFINMAGSNLNSYKTVNFLGEVFNINN